MKRGIQSALLIFSLICTSSATQKHWVGSGTGQGRLWGQAANWSLTQGGAGNAGVPTASDSVFIDGATNMRVNVAAVCAYINISVSTGTKDFLNASTLTVGTGGIVITGGSLDLTASSDSVTVKGSLTISGGGMSLQTAGSALLVAGNWSQSGGGTFTQTAGNVTLNGSSAQSLLASSAFGNLIVNNSSGVNLSSDVTVNGILTLTSGLVNAGAHTLIVSSTGSVSRTSGRVAGNLQKNVATGATSVTYELGDATNYTPVTVAFGNVTVAGDLKAMVTPSEDPNIATSRVDATHDVNRYWTLTNSGVTFNNYGATFTFVAGDVDAGSTTSTFIVDNYVAPTWFATTAGTRTATTTQATGITRFGDFAIGNSKTITITSSAGANGSISPLGATVVAYNGSQGYTITSSAHYHVADVLVDGVSVGAVTSYNFTTVTQSHTISASFAIDTYTITASAGANGSISPSGPVIVNYGSSQGFTITPNTGYHVADVLVDGASAGAVTSYNFPSVSANHTISASFAIDTLTITASAGANGSISPSGAVAVLYGGNQSFTITPAANYHVADVLVDGSSIGAVTSHDFTNVTANHTISATFAIDSVTITASAGANGSISPSGAVPVPYGGNQSFTVTANTGYHVADVLVDGVSVGAVTSHDFTSVTAGHTIAASFAIDTLTITASAGANGSISPSGAVAVLYGSSQSFTITPNTGYHVADVLVDGSSIGAVTSHDFTGVTANHTISASFAIDTLTITASAGANGSISPSGAVAVLYGGSQSFTITPAATYHVSDVVVDGSSVGAVTSYDFTNVTGNHTIVASFTINGYTITASAGANGSISPSGPIGLTSGANQSFTITPNTGYHVSDVLVDGSSVGAVTTYDFTNVTANHTIDASFAVDTLTVTASAGANGSISPSGSVPVTYGASQSFTVTPSTGYHVADVVVDKASVGAVTSYDFTNVTANHTISATFAINNYTISATAHPHGSVSPAGDVGVTYGADQSFNFTPDTGYYVSDVHVDSVSVGAVSSYDFHSVAANHTIEAFFALQSFTLNASATAHGTISPSGAVSADYGSSRLFTITPDTGYFISDVHVDSVSVGAVGGYKFSNVTANHTIQAFFAIQTFVIKGSAGPHGTITPSGGVVVNYNGSQSFVVQPDSGYFITDVHVDTFSVGAVSTYKFHNVTANHTINATFGLINNAPSAALLVTPLNYDSVTGTSAPVNFAWHPSTDPDAGDTVGYSLHVWGPGLDTTASLRDTTLSLDLRAQLAVGSSYQWTVSSTDTKVTVASPDTFHFSVSTVVTGVADLKRIPKEYALYQNYPNPFNPTTRLQYDIPQQSTVTIKVYNILGAEVATLVDNELMDAGYKHVDLNGSNLGSGIYFYRITADGVNGKKFMSVKKMTLLK